MKNAIYLLILCCFCSLFSSAQTPTWNWAKTGAGLGGDCQATAIMTDALGNVYAGGFYTASNIIFGSDTLVGGPGARMFFNKYDKNGQLIWTHSSNSDSSYGWSITPYSIKMDASSYLYVAGEAQTRTAIWGQDVTDAGCGKDFVAKYDPQGNPIWGRFATSRGYDEAKSVAVDSSGNVYMFGDFFGENIGFGADSFYNHNPNSGTHDLLLIKYDSSGNKLWAKSFGGDGDDYAQTINIDRSGNLYIQGYFQSDTIAFGNTTLINSDTGQHNNIFVVKCDANGNVIWGRNNGGKATCDPSGAAMDAEGNTYVIGTFGNYYYGSPTGDRSVSFGNFTLTDSPMVTKLFLVKYDVNGNIAWAKLPVKLHSVNGTAYSVAIDNIGNVYLNGDFMDSSITNGIDTLAPNSLGNLFFAKYDSTGNPLWLKGISGTYLDASCMITAGANDNVYMAAGIDGPSLIFDSITTLTINSSGLRSPIMARLGHDAMPNGIISETASNADLFISPNPFENNAVALYSLPSNAKNASLITYDMLGRIKGSYKLNDKEGQITISSDTLISGIYFYSLKVDGKLITTRKIVVAK